MFANLLIGLREGLEAALIVSILLVAVRKLKRPELGKHIWLGTGAAVLLSVLVGSLLQFTIGALPEPGEQIFAGTTSLIAVALLTWMIFWMAGRSRSLRSELEGEVEQALAGGRWTLPLVAFVAVMREGLETALFLWAGIKATSTESDATPLLGGLLGLILATLLGVALYRGALRVNLAKLFRYSGAGLVLVAAGVLTYAVHEFQEIGWLPGAENIAFDISNLLPADSALATLLRGLLNFRPVATMLEVAAWWLYMVPTMAAFFRRGAAVPAPASAA